eukprot:13483912-Ditylum_brightwellii.AAC.1
MPDVMPYADNDGNSSVESKCNDENVAYSVLVGDMDSVNTEGLWDRNYQMSDDEGNDCCRNGEIDDFFEEDDNNSQGNNIDW